MSPAERDRKLADLPLPIDQDYLLAVETLAVDLQDSSIDVLFNKYIERGSNILTDTSRFYSGADKIANILTPVDKDADDGLERTGFLPLVRGLQLGALIVERVHANLITAGESFKKTDIPSFPSRSRNIANLDALGRSGLTIMGNDTETVIASLEAEGPAISSLSRIHVFRTASGLVALNGYRLHEAIAEHTHTFDIERQDAQSKQPEGAKLWDDALRLLIKESADTGKND